MTEQKPKQPWEHGDGAKALEALAAASAVGITVATQAVGFWLSMMSGVTAAARDTHARSGDAPAAPKAEAPKPRPTADIIPLQSKPAIEKLLAAKPVPETTAAVEAKPVIEVPVSEFEPIKTPESDIQPAVVKSAPAGEASAEPRATPEPKKAAPKPAAKKTKPKFAAIKPDASPAATQAPILSSKPKGHEKPSQPDDLKLIKGVGPKLETTLNGLGIWTFDQIALLQPAEVAWLDDYLGLGGRIVRDGWIEAAKAGGKHG
jgi:NADH-quinone oxidoreductase subunit E